jgi:hypothetical protein
LVADEVEESQVQKVFSIQAISIAPSLFITKLAHCLVTNLASLFRSQISPLKRRISVLMMSHHQTTRSCGLSSNHLSHGLPTHLASLPSSFSLFSAPSAASLTPLSSSQQHDRVVRLMSYINRALEISNDVADAKTGPSNNPRQQQ